MIQKNSQELPIPNPARDDPTSAEILRIWLSQGEQHVTLRHEISDDPGAWGLLLVDVARHVSNAYAQSEGADPKEVLNRIKWGFDAEWDNPTDQARGSVE